MTDRHPLDPLGLWGRVLPDPLGIFAPPAESNANTGPSETSTPVVAEHGCRYGMECIVDHMLRSYLYTCEAIRFSSGGSITPEAQDKLRLARAQLLCEDDFGAALSVGPPLSYEVMKLLAACRSTWKAMDASGVDQGRGTLEDLQQISEQVKTLYQKAYEIKAQYRPKEES